MQYFCSEFKTESLLNMGLDTLKEIEEVFVPRLYALDPHKLMRSIEDLSMLAHAQMVLQPLWRGKPAAHLSISTESIILRWTRPNGTSM